MRVDLLVRALLLLAIVALVAVLGGFLRQLGLSEIAVVFLIVALLFMMEGARFVVRQFLKGYRGER